MSEAASSKVRVLLVHPSPLMHSELFLRLEPLGLERVASAVRAGGHEVEMVDLQVYAHVPVRLSRSGAGS